MNFRRHWSTTFTRCFPLSLRTRGRFPRPSMAAQAAPLSASPTVRRKQIYFQRLQWRWLMIFPIRNLPFFHHGLLRHREMFSWRGLMTLRHRKFSFSTPSNKFQINLHFVPVLWEKAWLNVWLRWLNEMVERLVEIVPHNFPWMFQVSDLARLR